MVQTWIYTEVGTSTCDPNKITKRPVYDVHYRYKNWICVKGEGAEGLMYFEESYVIWLRQLTKDPDTRFNRISGSFVAV